jgi:thiol-disulfide isomerase/thioredoxin
MHSLILRAAVAVCLMSVAACSREPSKAAQNTVKPGEKRNAAADFELTDADGRKFKLSDYKGKVVLLNFWATWCGPCKLEIPWFIDFEKTYRDKGFSVIGVSLDEEGWEVVKPYLEARKVNYRSTVGTDAVAQLYGGIEALPTTFVIDREGRIASTHVGLVSRKDYEDEIVQLLR